LPKQDEIDRMIVMIYASRNSAGFTNFTRPAYWLDGLPMSGLDELRGDFDRMSQEVAAEIEQRKNDGILKFSRRWHEKQEGEIKAGSALLSEIGIGDGG